MRDLIGREAELESITGMLAGSRLLSLVGPGGAGKTSLAVAAAVRMAGVFPDGAFEVRLSPVASPDQVPLAFADALGVPLDGAAADADLRRRLVAFLGHRRVLLLVDNCEHVVDAAAGLVDRILQGCPGVTVLATSREALAVPGEIQIAVGPLAVAPVGTAAARVLDFPATQLFVERARSIRPGLVLGAEHLLAVGSIARSLDGIPLALELAAARVSAMSPGEISERLEHRFSLLTCGARTAESRQQTLRAAVDWSHELLTERNRRSSVGRGVPRRLDPRGRRGGRRRQRGRAGSVLDTVGRLVGRSMVTPNPDTRRATACSRRCGSTRRTDSSGRRARTRWPAARDVLPRTSSERRTHLRGHGQRQTLQRLREEQPNIRAALRG